MIKKYFPLITITIAPCFVEADEIEKIVVTGTYTAMQSNESTATVTVLERDDISKLGKTNVIDVLRSVSGLTVRQFGGAGGINELSIRGGESNFTLVMIDGVKVNDSTNTRGGGYNFNSLNVNSIERIEIIRGTQSAVYGGDALSGVVNIITRIPEKNSVNQQVFLDVGQYGYYSAGYDLAINKNDVTAKVNISTTDRGDEITGSTYENKQVLAGLGWQATTNTNLSWKFRYLDDERYSYPEQSGGDIYSQSDLLEFNSSEEYSQNFSWQQNVHDFWQSRVDINLYKKSAKMDSPGILPYDAVPPNNADTEFKNTEYKWINTLAQHKNYWFNVGAILQEEEGDSVGSLAGFMDTSFYLKRKNKAAFIESHYENQDVFSAQMTIRYDDPDALDSEISTNVGLELPINSAFSLAYNWGEGFKLPSFFALAHPLVGNPALKPERSKTQEIRLTYKSEQFGYGNITWFDSAFSDLVDFDPELFTNVNRAKVDIDGFEADWTLNSSENSQIKIYTTQLNIDTHDKDVVLSGRPETQYGANFNWAFSSDKSVNIDFIHVSEQFDTSLYSGSSVREALDSYNLIGANLAWQITEKIDLLVAVNNLLDEEYFEAVGFSSPGRNFHLKTTMSF